MRLGRSVYYSHDDGKITSKSGPVSTSTTVKEQPGTVRDDRRLSPIDISSGAPTTLRVPGH